QLAGDGREAGEHAGLLARLQEVRLRVLRDIVQHLELTEGAGALGVRAALRDALAVEARELLDECDVVEQQRAVGADAQRVRIGFARCAGLGGGGLCRIELCHGLPSDRNVSLRERVWDSWWPGACSGESGEPPLTRSPEPRRTGRRWPGR